MEGICKICAKVNLDKSILFREKQSVLWRDIDNQNQTNLEDALRKGKNLRHDLNKKQKEAYEFLLQFIKERNSKPVKEEK